MSGDAVLAYVRQRWWVVVASVVVIAGSAWLGVSAINDSAERRASRARIEASAHEAAELAKEVKAQSERIERVLTAVETATSRDAQARSAANLARAIAELRRSIDCVALYINNERPPACVEVAGRMDRIRAGEDPFDFSTPPPTPGAP